MFMNVKNFMYELDMYNEILNATEDRDYMASAEFITSGYDITLKNNDDDALQFILRATDNSCTIYPQCCKYGGQYITFCNDTITFDEMVKLIGNFFYEVE